MKEDSALIEQGEEEDTEQKSTHSPHLHTFQPPPAATAAPPLPDDYVGLCYIDLHIAIRTAGFGRLAYSYNFH